MNAIDSKHMVVTDNTNIDIAISDAMSMIEENGYDPSGFVGRIGVKNMLRKLRDANGAPAYVNGTTGGELYGQPIEFVRNGAWDINVPILSQVILNMPLSVCVQVLITKFLQRQYYKALLTVTVNRYHLPSKIWLQSRLLCV